MKRNKSLHFASTMVGFLVIGMVSARLFDASIVLGAGAGLTSVGIVIMILHIIFKRQSLRMNKQRNILNMHVDKISNICTDDAIVEAQKILSHKAQTMQTDIKRKIPEEVSRLPPLCEKFFLHYFFVGFLDDEVCIGWDMLGMSSIMSEHIKIGTYFEEVDIVVQSSFDETIHLIDGTCKEGEYMESLPTIYHFILFLDYLLMQGDDA